MPRADPDVVGAGQGAATDAGHDLVEQCLGGVEQGAAFAGAFGGQQRVAAGDQPLAGVVGVGDLGQVLLVEQGQLQRPVRGGERGDRRRPQAGQPAQPAEFLQGLDPGGGDHAPVADHHHLPQPEPGAHDLHGVDERGRVGGAAVEDPDRDRPAVGVGEQPVLDLRLTLPPVAGVAPRGQRAAPALHPGRGQVEQRHPRRIHLRVEVAAG